MKILQLNVSSSVGRSRFSGGDLGRQGKCVGEKELGEAGELGEFLISKLVLIVRSLIAIKTNEVRPLFKIVSEFSSFVQGINARREILAGKRAIQLSGRYINRLAIHRCCRIHVLSFSVICSLLKSTLDRNGYVVGHDGSMWSGINKKNFGVVIFGNLRNFTASVIQPVQVSTESPKAYADNVVASVALKNYGWTKFGHIRRANQSHADRVCQAVRTIANVGNSHV